MQVEKDESSPSLVAGVQTKQDAMMEILSQVMQRLDRLEKDRNARETPPTNERESTGKRDKEVPSRSGERRQQLRSSITCRRSHKEGHFAQGCATITPGKLDTLAAKGRACESEPRKACNNNIDAIRISPVNPIPAYGIQG